MSGKCAFLAALLLAAIVARGCTSSPEGLAGPSPSANPYEQAPQVIAPAATPSGDPACISLGCPAGTNYVGSMKSDKYHFCSCEWARRISPANLVCFMSADEAASSGYVPCKVCRP
jgi:hypothetical protein